MSNPFSARSTSRPPFYLWGHPYGLLHAIARRCHRRSTVVERVQAFTGHRPTNRNS